MHEHAPHIVKVGGSLLASPCLPALLARLAGIGAPLVLAPGGGPFADAVRLAQPQLGFSDEAAHRMAILAMEQTALALADIEPRLVACTDGAAIKAAHRAGRAVLWLPARMALKADVPASWDVTSDSLAAWLAIALGAARLTLVKAASVPHPCGPPQRWAEAGLVDPHFPAICQRFTGAVWAISVEAALEWEAMPA